MKQKKWLFLFFLMISSILIMADSFPLNFDRYHTPDELNQSLKKLANLFPRITKLHKIAISPGGRKVMLLEIGPEVKNKRKKNPAILVVANMSGTVPISSEGAMKTIQIVLDKEESRSDKTWYIFPVGNPDALNRYFSKPLAMNSRNSHPHNDDMDDQLDEDGTEDLDGNGIISMMRVKSPEGKWIPIPGEPRMMKKADWSKGEKGLYKVYVEGIDNDGDGIGDTPYPIPGGDNEDRYPFMVPNGWKNKPPNEIYITGPEYGDLGVKYTFYVEIVDPDGDSIYCMWDWGDVSYSAWLGPFDSG
ncbi:MAG: hypothetical protein KAS65_12080, partial [Candidatus Aminicenantes bacterium]|nr:hypothetical protein [Candidatus Aminicenantes bacterium]